LGLLDGDIETSAGTETVVDAVLDCRDEAIASTPPLSGQKQNVEHLAGTSCIAPPTCGFQTTSSLMRDWESSVNMIESIVATIVAIMLFISATHRLHTLLLDWDLALDTKCKALAVSHTLESTPVQRYNRYCKVQEERVGDTRGSGRVQVQ
jgi:hypothetical protein